MHVASKSIYIGEEKENRGLVETYFAPHCESKKHFFLVLGVQRQK